jgi:imidazolonepropionase-like amidohydrolase
MPADFRIHDYALEASWVAKYAGLSELEAIRLVSSNVEEILGLEKSKDMVIWEGNPLQHGASVALAFHSDPKTGKLELATCWPEEHDE